jgi:hypothetical protein
MNNPRGVVRKVKTGLITFGNNLQPRGYSLRVAGKESSKSYGKAFLQSVVGQWETYS